MKKKSVETVSTNLLSDCILYEKKNPLNDSILGDFTVNLSVLLRNQIFRNVIAFSILFLSVGYLHSQTINRELMPELFSPSNAGTEFHVSFVPVAYDKLDNFNIVTFHFSSSVNTEIRLKIPQTFIDTTFSIKPNQVNEFTLEPDYVMPYTRVLSDTSNMTEKVTKRSVQIYASSPVICYAMVRLRNFSEGFLVLPVNFWGKDYHITTFSDFRNNINQFAPATAVIVSGYDNSRVTFQLGGNEYTSVRLENGDSIQPGELYVRTLNEGDVWVIPGFNNFNDLSGSTIKSTKPIAVYTGNYCARVDTTQSPCNYMMEQELPLHSFSKRYYVTPVFGRTKGSFVKVSAHSANTVVKVNGITKGTIKEISGINDKGYLSFRINEDNKPAIISSDSRINVVQFNNGDELNDKGSPFKMQVLSSDHFSKFIKFNLPASQKTEYFTTNYLNIILKLDSEGKIPEDLILTEFVNGVQSSKTVREIATREPIPFPESESDGTTYYSLTINLPGTGNYVLKSSKPVGAVMYGSVITNSYGFPASIRLVNHDKVNDVQPPSMIFTEYQNGNFTGTITDEPANQSLIRSNLAMVHLVGDSSYNFEFAYDNVNPGTDTKSSFDLRPKNISLSAQAYIRAVDYAGNDTIYRFYYSNEIKLPKVKITEISDSVFCPETEYLLNFDVSVMGFMNTNTFRLKLGKVVPDIPGFPMTVAEISSSTARDIKFTLPITLNSANDYFLYIETTSPAVRSDTISFLGVNSMPALTISGYGKAFSNAIYEYSTQVKDVNYKWSVTNGEIIGVDNSSTVKVKWDDVRSCDIILTYTSSDGCTITRQRKIETTPDDNNAIEGINVVCLHDELFFNSKVSTGKFQWNITGGVIVGNKEEYLISVKWTKPGDGNIQLIHTDLNSFVKEMNFSVLVKDAPEKPTITRAQTILTSSSPSGNQWYFNGELIPGARAKSFDAGTNEGTYTVKVTIDGCSSEFSDDFIYKQTSVKNLSADNFISLYPNPTNDILNIDLNIPTSGKFRISILNSLMSELDVVFDGYSEVDSNTLKYSTSNLAVGTYYIRLDYNGFSKYSKFVVMR